MKSKILLLLSIIIFVIITMIPVFSIDSEIIEESNNYYISGNQSFPYWVKIYDKHDKITKTVYLYDLELQDVLWGNSPIQEPTIKLFNPDQSSETEYKYIWGQIFNWAVNNSNKVQINNKGYLGDLPKSENFNAIYAILENRRNKAGVSFKSTRGKTYPLRYPGSEVTWEGNTYQIDTKSQDFPENWNFKILPDTSTDSEMIPWLTTPSGLQGLSRYLFAPNPEDEYGRTMGFANDIDDYVLTTEISAPNIMLNPWAVVPALPMDKGQVNKDYENLKVLTPEMITTYKVFRTFYPTLANLMNATSGANWNFGAPAVTIEEQTARFLQFFAVRNYAGEDSYGWIEMKNDWDPNGSHFYTYFSIRTPKLVQNRDLIFGTKDKPVRKHDNTTGLAYGSPYQMQLWNRDANNNGIFNENGETIQIKEDSGEKLLTGHKYSLHSFLKLNGKTGEESYHFPIVANMYMGFNEYAEGGTKARQALVEQYGTGGELHGKIGVDPENYETAYTGKIKTGTVLDYRYIDNVVIPKTFRNPATRLGEVVTKVSIYSYTPYQALDPYDGTSHPNYHVKREDDTYYLAKDDNASNAPDFSVLTFDVEPPERDLMITDFRLYDPSPENPANARFLAEGENIEREKTYKAVITVKNKSDFYTTDKPISIVFFDGIKNQVYTTPTGVTATHTQIVNNTNNQLPKNSAGTENPVPPMVTTDPTKGTVQFIIDVPVPKEGVIPSNVKFTALIPEAFDVNKGGKDNIRNDKEDVVTRSYKTGPLATENLKITGLELYDGSNGTNYNSVNPDGTYKFNPNRTYTATVTMQKDGKKQLGSSTDPKHPEVLLKVIEYTGSSGSTTIQNQYYIRAKSNGYYQSSPTQISLSLEFNLNKFPINGNGVTLIAMVPDEYSNFNGTNYNEVTGNEDKMEKTWSSELDFAVSNFILNPSVTYAQGCTSSLASPIAFSATLSMINNTANINVTNVSVVVKDKNGSIVYRDDNVSFVDGQYSKTYSGSFPNPYTLRIDNFTGQGNQQGNNPFTIEINTTPAKYQETIIVNNKETNEVILRATGCPGASTPSTPCLVPHTRNDWGPITFYYSQRTGTMHSKQCTGQSCSKDGGCTTYTYTVYWCDPDNSKSWTTNASFYETFNITGIWFRSQDTVDRGISGYINIIGNKNGTVRSGQWYEVFIETEYKTNRMNMPSPNPSYNDMCNWITRSPGYNQLTNTPPFIWWKMSGYGVDEFMPYNYGVGGYVKKYYLPTKIDKFGQTSSRRFVVENGKNGEISIMCRSGEFYGYTYDYQHPYNQLCDVVTNAKIYIIGGSNVKSQITEE